MIPFSYYYIIAFPFQLLDTVHSYNDYEIIKLLEKKLLSDLNLLIRNEYM